MKKLLLAFLLSCLMLSMPAFADSPAGTLYVRDDGGTPNGASGKTCNGLTDAAWNLGNSPNCAFNHPNWAVPPNGQPTTWRVAQGSMVVIHGPDDGAGTGIYRMGCSGSANCLDATINLVNGTCNNAWSYDCASHIIPNGLSNSQRTIIRGCSSSGCGTKRSPQLWLAGRANELFNIQGAHDITLSYLEITDHAAQGIYDECTTGSSGLCGRQAFNGANFYNFRMENLNIHGLTQQGGKMGGGGPSMTNVNWEMENVRVAFNPGAGLDTDTCGNAGTCGFMGNINWKNVEFSWNGCVEPYPIVTADTPVPNSCRDNNVGGYGDGYGGSDSGGTWNIDGLVCKANTSDCLDLLYCGRQSHGAYGACQITLNRVDCQANSGNCIKVPTSFSVVNSKLIGNCAWWSTHTGYMFPGMLACRQGGTAAHPITIATNSDEGGDPFAGTPYIANNTVMSNADGIILYGGACPGTRRVTYKNNIFIGGLDYGSGNPGELTDLFYVSGRVGTNDGCTAGQVTITEDHNICVASTLKLGTAGCNHATDKNVDPQFIGTIQQGIATYPGIYSGINYTSILDIQSTSPAINSADETASFVGGLDFNGNTRGVTWDIGAVEYNAGSPSAPSANGASCSTGTQCLSGICCASVCSASACPSVPTTFTGNAVWNGSFGR